MCTLRTRSRWQTNMLRENGSQPLDSMPSRHQTVFGPPPLSLPDPCRGGSRRNPVEGSVPFRAKGRAPPVSCSHPSSSLASGSWTNQQEGRERRSALDHAGVSHEPIVVPRVGDHHPRSNASSLRVRVSLRPRMACLGGDVGPKRSESLGEERDRDVQDRSRRTRALGSNLCPRTEDRNGWDRSHLSNSSATFVRREVGIVPRRHPALLSRANDAVFFEIGETKGDPGSCTSFFVVDARSFGKT